MKYIINRTLQSPTAGADPTTTPDPATTMLTPDEAVQALRALQARIPIPDASRLPHVKFNSGNVDPQFVTASINAIGAVDAVQAAVGRTDEDVRQEVEAAARWTAFTDELRTVLAAATQADHVRRQSVNLAALQTYNICRQLARDTTRAPQVKAHVQEMKRLNKLGRKKTSSTTSQPEPTSAPPSPATIPM
ncbi:MAG TPA: hypothetical protein VGJ82_05180 [Thermoanaerobaculia bacterium]|jgi:hypothetical protein